MTSKTNDRFNARVTPELKHLINGIQQYNNYTQNGILSHFVDLYFKYHEGSSDKQIAFFNATVKDPELLESIIQTITDFNLTDVMKTHSLCSEIKILRVEVAELRSQIQHILAQNPSYLTDNATTTHAPVIKNDALPSLATVSNDEVPQFTVTYSDFLFPSNISAFTNTSLNTVLHNVLSPLLKSSHNKKVEFGYDYFMANYNDIKTASHINKNRLNCDVLAIASEKIALFSKELNELLSLHCDNEDMCDSLLPKNPNTLSKYIETRLLFSGKENSLANKDIWSFTLLELHGLIQSLDKYEVTNEFKLSARTMKSPQSALKTSLSQSYGFICGATTEPFTTF